MPCSCVLGLCQYETSKLVRIQSVRIGSLKWILNVAILLGICVMMLWNKEYQEFDPVVSSVTTKVKGVAQMLLPGVGDVVWDEADYSGASQDSRNVRTCKTDRDCEKGRKEQQSHGINTGSCVEFDLLNKTCEVSAWCPIETETSAPRPALLAAAENFTVMVKNNIRFPKFNFIRRNILPQMNPAYLKSCQRVNDSLCPIFKLGDMVREAGEKFSELAVEGGIIGMQIKWDCNLDWQKRHCLPSYSFRRLDERENNKTLYHGLSFRFAKYYTVNGVEERTLYKAFVIRFDVMVFGKAGRFSIIHSIIYIGSTLSYYALTAVFLNLLIRNKRNSAVVELLPEESGDDPGPTEAGGHRTPEDQEADPEPKAPRPAWCRCNCCTPSSLPQEELCHAGLC